MIGVLMIFLIGSVYAADNTTQDEIISSNCLNTSFTGSFDENELHSSVFSSFDKLQDGSVKDMLKSIENNPIDKIKTTCKFVSLF